MSSTRCARYCHCDVLDSHVDPNIAAGMILSEQVPQDEGLMS